MASYGVDNFLCGIGEHCNAGQVGRVSLICAFQMKTGLFNDLKAHPVLKILLNFQLCSPIMSVEAWLVAFSVQQWNSYMNNCFDAIGYSMSTTSCKYKLFYPCQTTSATRPKKTTSLCGSTATDVDICGWLLIRTLQLLSAQWSLTCQCVVFLISIFIICALSMCLQRSILGSRTLESQCFS